MKMGIKNHYDIHDTAFSGDYRQLKKILQENPSLSNLRDEYGQSPLHKASMNGWLSCVELLLEHNSNTNAVDVAGCTPLHLAAANGYVTICKYLVEQGHACVTIKSNKGYTPHYMARMQGQCKAFAYLNQGLKGKYQWMP